MNTDFLRLIDTTLFTYSVRWITWVPPLMSTANYIPYGILMVDRLKKDPSLLLLLLFLDKCLLAFPSWRGPFQRIATLFNLQYLLLSVRAPFFRYTVSI